MATPAELKAFVAEQVPDNITRKVKPVNVRNSFDVIIDQVIPLVDGAVVDAQASADAAEIAKDQAVTAAGTAQANATQTTADVATTTANKNLTAADVTSTHADVVLTHADVVLTHADVVTTGNNVTAAQTAKTAAETAATNSANSATSAALVDQGGTLEVARSTLGSTNVFTTPNQWPDPNLLNTTLITNSGTGTYARVINRNRPAIQITGGTTKVVQAILTLEQLRMTAGKAASFGVFLDSKSTALNTNFTLNIEEQDVSGAVLLTTTQNSPTGIIVTGTPAFSSPQPVLVEGLVLNAATVKIRFYFTVAGTTTVIVSRFLAKSGTRADYSPQISGHAHRLVASPNLFRNMKDTAKFLSGTSGVGTDTFVTFNGKTCLNITSNTNRVTNIDHNYTGDTGIGVVAGDKISLGLWVESIPVGATVGIVVTQQGGTVSTEANFSITEAANVFPLFVPLEGITVGATNTSIRIQLTGGGVTGGANLSQFTIVKGPNIVEKSSSDFFGLVPQMTTQVDRRNGVVRYGPMDLVVNGVSKYTITPITFDATKQTADLTLPITGSLGIPSAATPYVHVFDVAAAIAGTNPFKEYVNGALPLDMSNLIIIGYANAGNYSSPFFFTSNDRYRVPNEIANGNLVGNVLGAGVTWITAPPVGITDSTNTDLAAHNIKNSVKFAAASGTYTARVRIGGLSTKVVQGAPMVAGIYITSDDGTWPFTAGSGGGPTVIIRQTNSAVVVNPQLTKFEAISANCRKYLYESLAPTGLAAGQEVESIEVGCSVLSTHTNNMEVSGFFVSTLTGKAQDVDTRNWGRSAYGERNVDARLTSAETRLTADEIQIAANTTAIAGLAGAATVTNAAPLIPRRLFFKNDIEAPIFLESALDMRDVTPSARRMSIHSDKNTYEPYARQTQGGSLVVNPAKLGPTMRVGLQSIGAPDTYKYKDIDIFVASLPKTQTVYLMCLGDSVTLGFVVVLKAKCDAAGINVVFVGTQPSSLPTGNRAEGRSGWRFPYWTYATAQIPPLAIGQEAAYMADPSGPTYVNVNPYLRVATGGEPAGTVFNGYVFDPAFGQSRFNALQANYIQTATHAIIAMGINDINSTTSANASTTRDLPAMVTMLKLWNSNIKIGIVPPDIGTGTLPNGDQRFGGTNGVIGVRKKIFELYDQTVVANVDVLAPYLFMDHDIDYSLGSDSVDAQTGVITGPKADYLHPVASGRNNLTDPMLWWLLNRMT